MKRIYKSMKAMPSMVFILLCLGWSLSQAQDTSPGTVSGRVQDNTGQALAGVSVVETGTTNGTATDASGRYTLKVKNPSARLSFSFSGFLRQEQAVSGRSTINIRMAVNNKILDEVVVTGYSSQNKRDITGAVSTVNVKDLEAVPGNNFAQQLQGRVAGVAIGNDGSPGADINVRIRGIGSITGSNDPLYVIDGVPTTGGLNSLNSNDIESMQVLKDAASASVYGARANNGVVIITTKKGKTGKSQLTFDAYYGIQKLTGRLPQYVNVAQSEYLSGILNPLFGSSTDSFFGPVGNFTIPTWVVSPGIGVAANDPRADPSKYDLVTNPIAKANLEGGDYWFHQLYHPAVTQNYNIGLSGGNENGKYAFSLGYQNQDGILHFTGFKRYSMRINTDFNIGNFLHVGENLSGTFTDRVSTFRYDDNSPLTQVNTTFFQPVYDIKGNFTGSNMGNFFGNPYATLYWGKDQHDYNARIFGNTYAEADILPGLKAKTSFGIDLNGENWSRFNPTQYNQRTAVAANLDVQNTYTYNWVWTNTLSYDKTFGKHHIAVVAGTEALKNNYHNYDAQKNGYTFESPAFQYFDAASTVISASGNAIRSSLFSLFAKADYTFNDRYILSATVRRDESSRFSPSNQFGVFPAASAGWRISKEDFMRNVSFISDLKLRASWGKTGNQNIDENNQYTTYSQNQGYGYDFGGTSNSANTALGIAKARQGNQQTKWESQSMTNLGLDYALFQGHLTGSIDAYRRLTSGLLLSLPHPATDGPISFGQVNIGSVENKGLEFQLGYNGTGLGKELKYSFNGNISFDRNKVLSLFAGPDSYIGSQFYANGYPEPTRTAVGHPVSAFYGYVIRGIFQTQAEADAAPIQGGDRSTYNQPGRWRYKDLNGDGVIDDKDQTYIGNPLPKFNYGMNFSASYKGFDATVFLQGVYGNDIFNAQLMNTDFTSAASFPSTDLLNSWSPSNPNALLPKLNPNADGLERQASTFFVEKGSYLRLKNLQIGYTLPASLSQKLKFSRIHFYIQGSNLATWTKYRGVDPEVNTRYNGGGADQTIGVDRGIYPLARTYLFGMQLGL